MMKTVRLALASVLLYLFDGGPAGTSFEWQTATPESQDIDLDDKAAAYVPQWKDDPHKSKITIRQLGSHTSGLADAESEGLPHDKLTGWKFDFWKRGDMPGDPFTITHDRCDMQGEPGRQLQYSNPGIAMLTYCVTAVIRNTAHKDIRTLLRERVL